jgi:hypothetical protein
MSESLSITPKTKIGELLDNYPHLEEVLLQFSSAFASLKNPILRKTVAKVASLQQAAAIGGIKVDELVNILRKEVGQGPLFGDGAESEYLSAEPPSWFNKSSITRSYDARELIQSGGSPMNHILDETRKLAPGEIFEFITPFIPAPIIDMIRYKGFLVFSMKIDEKILNWITKG